MSQNNERLTEIFENYLNFLLHVTLRSFSYTEKTGVSNFKCQNVDSQSELLDSTTLFPKFFLFDQGDTHLIFCLTVTRVSESL